jgi:hypothetical protein
MNPILAKIPLVRRPFYQRDVAYRMRDLAVAERDASIRDRGEAIAERDDAIRARDEAVRDRDHAVQERDAAMATCRRLRLALQEAALDGPTGPVGCGSEHRNGDAATLRSDMTAKIFCIGMGKTGTTSLEAFFRGLGFTLGNQNKGEDLLDDWATRNFAPIVAFARSAQVFQDIPFCLPFTYIALDRAFPGSKFILSVRNDAQEWYDSLVRFITMLVGKGRIPTEADLREYVYRHEGWIMDSLKLIYGVSEDAPFDKTRLTSVYERHNAAVKEYFKHRPDDLLTVNLRDTSTAERIMDFIGLPYKGETMPHLNPST